jgi:hypothetical protein
MGKFQDLKIWLRSKDLPVYIYKVTSKTPFSKDFSLKDQIRRASVYTLNLKPYPLYPSFGSSQGQ